MPVKSLNELRRQACTALEEALVRVYSKRHKKTIEETQQNTQTTIAVTYDFCHDIRTVENSSS